MRIQPLRMQRRRHARVLYGQDDLHQREPPRRRFEMTEVARGGADEQRLRALAIDAPNRVELDGVAQRRARSVSLEVLNTIGPHARLRERPSQYLYLCV